MDEMNPAYENFLNNMSRLGGTPRETTRRISPSKFLGRDNLENKININARKITILKNIIQAQKIQTGQIISSLSEDSSGSIASQILDIRETMSSILETLQAQEKFEYEKFLEMQRREQNQRRRKREKTLELDKAGMKIIDSGVKKVIKPVQNIFLRILGFFVSLGVGRILIKFLNFFKDPKNAAIVRALGSFIETFFPFIVGGIAIAGLGLGGLLLSFSRIGKIVTGIATTLFGLAAGRSGKITGAVTGRLTGRQTKIGKLLDPIKRFTGLGVPAITQSTKSGTSIIQGGSATNRIKTIFKLFGRRFSDGDVVPGTGNQDSVASLLTPGEFVIKKDSVKGLGLPFLRTLNEYGSRFKNFYNQGRNVRFPNENTARLRDLIKDDFSQITRTDKAFKEGAKGLKGARPLKAFTPNMMKTGPTPLIRQSIERPFRTMFGTTVGGFAKRLPILDVLLDLAFPKPLADGTLTGNMNAVPNLLPPVENQTNTSSALNFSEIVDKIQNPNKHETQRNELLDVSFNEVNLEKISTLGFEL